MNRETALTFNLPNGWTLRKVATALAREWLPPLRAAPVEKGASWVIQPIIEENGESEGPLWEPGISTVEYERRLDRPGLGWAVRAKSNRGKTSKAVILARFTMRADQPDRFEMVCLQDALPDTLFDAALLGAFLADGGKTGADGLFTGLLIEHGFQVISV
jgi:hypothetical protein